MADDKAPDERVAFALLPSTTDGGPPILTIGLTQPVWDKLKAGGYNSFDMTKVGLPIRVALFGAETYDAAVEVLFKSAKDAGIPVLDERRRDFSIELPKGH